MQRRDLGSRQSFISSIKTDVFSSIFVISDLDFDVHFAEILNRLILEQFEITIQTDQIESANKKNRNQIHQNTNEIQTEGFQTSHMQLPSVLDNLSKDSRLTGWKVTRGSSTRIWHESWGTTNRHFVWCFKWKRICIKWIQSKSSIGTILSREPFSQLRLMVCSFKLSPEGWYWLDFCGLLLLLFYGVDTG